MKLLLSKQPANTGTDTQFHLVATEVDNADSDLVLLWRPKLRQIQTVSQSGGLPIGTNGAVLTDGLGTGLIFPLESVVVANGSNLNALSVQNLNTAGWSSVSFRDALAERGAVGVGGSTTAAAAGYRGNVYLEASDVPLNGDAVADSGKVILSQFTTYGAAVALTWHHRVVLHDSGDVIVNAYDDSELTGHAKPIATFVRDKPIIRLGQNTGAFGYGEIQGADENWSFVFREGANSAVANSGYCVGGTLAAGGGWKLFTGGVKASQTLKLQVANDGIFALLPTSSPGGSGRLWNNAGVVNIT